MNIEKINFCEICKNKLTEQEITHNFSATLNVIAEMIKQDDLKYLPAVFNGLKTMCFKCYKSLTTEEYGRICLRSLGIDENENYSKKRIVPDR